MDINKIFSKTLLKGMVAVITGAGRGLGRVMALSLAEAGCDVVLTARTYEELESVVKEVEATGQKAIAVKMDVTQPGEISSMIKEAVSEFGKIDILVNNAGQTAAYVHHKFEDIPEDEWTGMMQTNVTGVFLVSKLVGRVMLGNGSGKVINIASSFGKLSIPGMTCYCVSKASVIHMTRAVAVEWADRGVTVNCIAPGSIDKTPDSTDEKHLQMNREKVRRIPMGRLGTPEELGPLLIYLASDASNYMTGETIYLDGGLAAV